MTSDYKDFHKDKSPTEISSNDQIRTTDVNILLNRVRLDKKKLLKKI